MAASRASWPLGRGFDRWYGFHGGETHQFDPALYHDNPARCSPARERTKTVTTWAGDPRRPRHREFLSDLRAVDDEQPFFCYLATGAWRNPFTTPSEWIARYKGHFDLGWGAATALRGALTSTQAEAAMLHPGRYATSPRPHWVSAWDAAHRRDLGRCFRGSWSASPRTCRTPTRNSVGCSTTSPRTVTSTTRWSCCAPTTARAPRADPRVRSTTGVRTTAQERAGASCASGSTRSVARAPTTTIRGAGRWRATPFRWGAEIHEGGVADPCIVRLPRGRVRSSGDRRHSPSVRTAVDILPTVLELAGIEVPDAIDGIEQSRVDGTSFLYALGNADAPGRHTTQYFEMLGSRSTTTVGRP